VRNIVIAQLILVPLVAALSLWVDVQAALAALYGGGIALGNTLLSARRVARAARVLDRDPGADVRSLYFGAVERFVFVLLTMALGMGWLRLSPPMLLLGFALAHLAYPVARWFSRDVQVDKSQS
jgi:ATP synthase protein I